MFIIIKIDNFNKNMNKDMANRTLSLLRSIFIVAAALVVGVFVFSGTVLAVHTASVTVDRAYTQTGPATPYTFTITKTGGDDLQYVRITIPTGFTYNGATCPFDWVPTYLVGPRVLKCDGEGSMQYITGSAQVIINTTPSLNEGVYSWTATTTDINETTVPFTPSPTTTVDNTSPIISINAVTTPTTISSQTVTGLFTETNIDNITVNGVPATIDGSTYSATIPLTEGSNTVTAVATDKVGLMKDANTAIVLDTIAPVTSDNASNDWSKIDVIVTLTSNDGIGGSGVAHTYYTTDGTTPTLLSNLYSAPFTLSTEGQHQLRYFSIDNVGNTEIPPVTGHLVKIDKSLPTSTYSINPLTPDVSGWYTITPTVTLSCTDQTELSGCDGVYYKLNDESYTKYTNPFTISDGDNTLHFYSKDNATNNQEVEQTRNIKVDTVKPTVSNNASSVWRNSDITVHLTSADTTSLVQIVKTCDGASCDPSIGTPIVADRTFSAEGTTIVKYQAWDNAGNASDVGTYTINIDRTPPTAGISGNTSNWVSSDQTATATCGDTGGSNCDTASYKLQVSTTPILSCSANPTDYTISTSATISQHSWVCSYVKDVAGNASFSPAVTEFKVDEILPTGELTGVPGSWQNFNATVGLTFGDAGGSGLASKKLDIVAYGGACTPTTAYTDAVLVSAHSIVCWSVTDNAGNSLPGSSVIKVDEIIPSVEAGLDKITKTQITQDATVSDGDSGVATYLWAKVSGPGNITFGSSGTEDTTISVDVDGVYGIKLTVIDNAGNSNSDTMQLIRDTVIPEVAITSPTDIVYKAAVLDGPGSIDLTFSASDQAPGTALQYTYKIDSGGYITPVAYTAPTTVPINGLSDGRHTLQLKIIDAAGNFTESNVLTFVIDNNNTLTVGGINPDFTTIQEGVDKVSSGGTVNVAAGTYTENVNVNKSLTLTGASSATVTVTAAVSNISVFNVTANSVNISGFTVTGANISTTAGIYLGNDVTFCNISNNNLTGNGDGIWLGSGSNHNTLENNTLSGNYQGFEVYHSDYNTFANNIADSNNVYGFKMESASHNTFTGNRANSNAKYGFYFSAGTTGSNNNTLTNNTADLNIEYGIRINSSDGNTLTNNTFNSNVVAGIRLKDVITNLTLRNNSFINSPIGVDIASGAGSVTSWILTKNNISGNTNYNVSNGGTGILNAAQNWWGTAYKPTIENKKSGLVTFEPYYIDEAMTILSDVPVSTVNVDDNFVDGSAGSGIYGYSAFSKIQEGVDKVSSSGIVNVAAGTYTEQINITKSLTITGAGSEITHIVSPNPAAMAIYDTFGLKSSTSRYIFHRGTNIPVIRIASSNVILEGLHVNMNGYQFFDVLGSYGSNYSRGVGILVDHVESTLGTPDIFTGIQIRTNKVDGMRDNDKGDAIKVLGSATVTIQGNTIYAYGESAINVQAVDSPIRAAFYPTVTANSNIIYAGALRSSNFFGIGYWSGATGSAAWNTIYNSPSNAYGYALNVWTPRPVSLTNNTITTDGGAIGGYGAQLYESSDLIFSNNIIEKQGLAGAIWSNPLIIISNNTISNCMDVFIVDNQTSRSVTLRNNTFTGVTNLGVKVGGTAGETSETAWGTWAGPSTVTVDARNNYWGADNGPRHSSNLTGTGAIVSDNVTFRPWYLSATLPDLDIIPPTLTITSSASSLTKTSPIPFDVNFNEPVNDFTKEDIVVTNGAIIGNSFSGLGGVTYNFTITPTNQGEVTVNIATNVAWDISGNYNTVATQFGITYDTAAPTATITNKPASLTNSTSTDITVGGEDVTHYQYKLDGGNYSAEILVATHIMLSGLSDGSHTLSVIGRDAAGNWQLTPTTYTWTVDTQAPTVVLSGTPANPTNQTGINITVAGTDVAYYKYKLDFGSYGSETAFGTAISRSGLAAGTHTISVIGRDVTDNWQLEASATSYTWTIDTAIPTITTAYTPSDNAVGVDPTGNITITFSEPVNVIPNDVSLSTGGSPVNVTISGSGTANINIVPDSILLNNSTYTVTIKNTVTDLAGNALAQQKVWSFTTAGSYSFTLTNGWNLVSLGVAPNNDVISTVLGSASSSIRSVWAYDANQAEGQQWSVYHPSSIDGTSNLSSMKAGKGYWVDYTGSSSVTLSGPGNLFLAGNNVPPSQTLKAGWNLIGYYQREAHLDASANNALKTLKNTDTGNPWWTMLVKYDNNAKQFGQVGNTENVCSGQGYWILMGGRASDTYVYAPGIVVD